MKRFLVFILVNVVMLLYIIALIATASALVAIIITPIVALFDADIDWTMYIGISLYAIGSSVAFFFSIKEVFALLNKVWNFKIMYPGDIRALKEEWKSLK